MQINKLSDAMLSTTHRLDLLRLSADLAKAQATTAQNASSSLETTTIEIFKSLKALREDVTVLEDTNMSDVMSAVDIASSLEEYFD